jgi:hypothetical protein
MKTSRLSQVSRKKEDKEEKNVGKQAIEKGKGV